MMSFSQQNQNDKVIFQFLQKFLIVFDFSEKRFAEVLGVSTERARSIILGEQPISIAEFIRLSRVYRFSMDAVSRGHFDIHAIKEHYIGNTKYVSERYSKGAFSRKFNAINVFNTIEEIRGPVFKKSIEEYVNAGSNIYGDRQGYINVQFFCDIFDLLKRHGVSNEEIVYMGKRSVDTAMQSQFGSSLSLEKSPGSLFEQYFGNSIRDLERNNFYRIAKIGPDFCIVDSIESEEVCDLFQVKHVGSRDRCFYRVGVIAATTRFIGHSDCSVIHTRCAFDGDPFCRFHIYYKNSARVKDVHHEVFY